MRLTDVIKIWDKLHLKDTGDIGYSDLEKAIGEIVGLENDVPVSQPVSPETKPSEGS